MGLRDKQGSYELQRVYKTPVTVRVRPVPNSDEIVEPRCPTTYHCAHINVFVFKIQSIAKTILKINITGNGCCKEKET